MYLKINFFHIKKPHQKLNAMEYWQDLYHELEQQKEKGLREGKKDGIIDGAQQASIISVVIFLMLWIFLDIMKQKAASDLGLPLKYVLSIYHMAIMCVSIFFLIKTLFKDKVLIGNLSLEEARTEGTKRAYIKSWVLQRDRYQSIGLTLIMLLNSLVYWGIASMLNLNPTSEPFKNETFAIIGMIVPNVALVIFTSVLKR